MNKTVIADAVDTSFVLSAELSESLAVAAEKVVDSGFDFRDGCEMVSGVFKALKTDNLLFYESWEVVRKRFESVASIRSRDNGAADPEAAANECWRRCTGYLKEYHGLTKPKSEKAESVEKAAKREAEKAKLVEVAAGRSVAELQAAKRELYAQADDESIAKAKAIENAIKVVQKTETDAIKSQMKPLVEAAVAKHKAILDLLKSDPKRMGDYVVLLAKTYDIWAEQLKS